jgi:magnesium-transporting ATPase (P-type)
VGQHGDGGHAGAGAGVRADRGERHATTDRATLANLGDSRLHAMADGLASVLLVIAPLSLFLWEIGHDRPLAEARTLAVNALVVGEIFYLLNSRRIDASVLSWDGLLGSRAVLASIGLILLLQLLFTYAPPVQTLMGTAAISAADWLIVTLAGTVLLLWVEAEKTRRRRWGQRA